MKKVNLLIVDDHPIVSEGLEFFLERDSSLRVLGVAKDAQSGLKKLRQLQPDLVILDLSLPDMDGCQAIGLFLKVKPQLKILVFSGRTEEKFVYQALQAGARGYVVKRGSFTDLTQAIHYLFEGGYWVSPEFSPALIRNYLSNLKEEDTEKSALAELTDREEQVLRLIVEGKETAEIGELLCISEKTISKHRVSMMRKLNMKNIIELTKFAIRNGLIDA